MSAIISQEKLWLSSVCQFMNSRMLNEISMTKGAREAHLFDYDASGQISAKIYQNETACFHV